MRTLSISNSELMGSIAILINRLFGLSPVVEHAIVYRTAG